VELERRETKKGKDEDKQKQSKRRKKGTRMMIDQEKCSKKTRYEGERRMIA
jgi:hypothetical protein